MEKLERFKSEFESDYRLTEEQRDKSNEEYRFFTVPGGQWEGFLSDAYENRAKLELDQTADYVYRTYGQWTNNRIGISFAPDDGETSEEDAELLNGIYRRDYRRNNGSVAIDNAVLEAFGSGIGAFHLSTEYDDKESIDDELKNVVFRPIHNAYSMVVWGPSKRIDKADAKRCTVIYEYSRDEFEEENPDINTASAVTPNDRRHFNWSSKSSIFVADRYEVKKEKTFAFVLQNIMTGEIYTEYGNDEKEVLKEAKKQGFELSRKKMIERQYVVKSRFYGDDFLSEEERIPGKYIPIIPLYGYRAFIDGVEYFHGLVRKRIDPQRLFNMQVSLLAENAASSYKRLPLFDPSQVKGLEPLWGSDLSKKNYMVARPIVDKQGNILHSGPVGYLDPPDVDQNTKALIELTSSFIGAGTGGAPQDTIDPDVSGKAINAVLKRVDLNVQPILENIATGLKWAGEVYRSIAADIYSDPRMIKTISDDGNEQNVMLMGQSIDDKTGNPITINDISRGRYECIVETGPSYETQREETLEVLKDIYQAIEPNNPYKPAILGMIISNMTGPGIEDLKEYVRKDLIMKGIKQPETDEETQMMQQVAGNKDPQAVLMESAAMNERMKAEKLAEEIKGMPIDRASKMAKAKKDMADAQAQEIENKLVASGVIEMLRAFNG